MCDYDPPECTQVRTVRARKPHVCCECRFPIIVGEHHEVFSGIWDGEPGRFRTCLTCVAWRDAYVSEMAKPVTIIAATEWHPAVVEPGDGCMPVFGDLIASLRELGRDIGSYEREA